jgi:aspartyl-tRNA synthetase
LMKLRDQFITHIREYMHKHDFIEINTPILANSSPEGARDFLVPSRIYPGKFFALPQAPQQFKQLLMVAGFDRYFQIAPCFRDEDPRADRHAGTFYQLDLEMSFVEQKDILDLVEPLMFELTTKFTDKKLVGLKNGRAQQLEWKKCMLKYGSDKPDLRIPFEIKSITDLIKGCGFKVFANSKAVFAMKIDKGGKFTRKQIDGLTELAKENGADGLAYIIVKPNELQSPIVKFLGEDLAQKIVKEVKAHPGDIIFFGATKTTTCKALGAAWLWVTDFPFYEYSEIEPGDVDFGHNPFSMPKGGLKALNDKNWVNVFAQQYDLIHNGFEMSSGAIRNHDPEIMYKAFEIVGYTREQVDKKFGHMIKAFEYGAPPHGGIAPGIDRMMMTLFDLESIRDIYAFPKDGKGKDLMLNSPMEVDEKQLKELHIRTVTNDK